MFYMFLEYSPNISQVHYHTINAQDEFFYFFYNITQNKHNRYCYGKKHKMLDIDILGDHGVQSTLIQRSETSRTMFIAVFNDVGGYSYDK